MISVANVAIMNDKEWNVHGRERCMKEGTRHDDRCYINHSREIVKGEGVLGGGARYWQAFYRVSRTFSVCQ